MLAPARSCAACGGHARRLGRRGYRGATRRDGGARCSAPHPAGYGCADTQRGAALRAFTAFCACAMLPQLMPNLPAAPFDAAAALSAIRARRAETKRRRTWGKSRLIPHRAELVAMRRAGATYAELVLWLRTERRVKINESSVRRWLQKLPELAEPGASCG